jgi:predicted MFS family arabinose efflux permease
VLAGNAGGWRLGLGVLQHHGVAAWLRAWDSLPSPPATAARSSEPAGPAPGSGEQLVAALATMALCCLARG